MPSPLTPKGIRLCNPGNIESTGIDWRGMAQTQLDPRFVTFSAPIYGLRALMRILINYQRKYALKTVREIISRWAPPGENDTAAYIDDVCQRIDTTDNAPIDLENIANLTALAAAIVMHENGLQPYAPALLREAGAMAIGKA